MTTLLALAVLAAACAVVAVPGVLPAAAGAAEASPVASPPAGEPPSDLAVLRPGDAHAHAFALADRQRHADHHRRAAR